MSSFTFNGVVTGQVGIQDKLLELHAIQLGGYGGRFQICSAASLDQEVMGFFNYPVQQATTIHQF